MQSRHGPPVISAAMAENPAEVSVGGTLVVFDGRVVELFGFPSSHGDKRFHVRNMELEIGEANRKGRRRVTIKSQSYSGGCTLEVDETDWSQLGPLLDQVRAAMPGPA